MPEEHSRAGELNHAEEILGVILPTGHGPSGVVEPGEEAFHLPTAPTPAERAAVLSGWPAASPAMRGDHLDAVPLAEQGVERIAVIAAVPDQPLWEVREEPTVEGGRDEVRLIR